MEKVDYKSGQAPAGYQCARCGAFGCKLWRMYQSFNVELLCVDCAEKDQGKKCKLELPRPEHTDQIGWLIPAIPDEEGEGFWGYASVPQEGCTWWDDLPIRTGPGPREWSPRASAEK